VSERLIFRRPVAHDQLHIEIDTDKTSYAPGEEVTVRVKAWSSDKERQTRTSAVLGVVVTDDSVLETVEKRKRAPRLPVMVYLEDEVERLDAAYVYLDPFNPLADVAVDLLLGTQVCILCQSSSLNFFGNKGWRRFVYTNNVAKFLKLKQDVARRMLVTAELHPPVVEPEFNVALRGMGIFSSVLSTK
jgi:hypothetical protein